MNSKKQQSNVTARKLARAIKVLLDKTVRKKAPLLRVLEDGKKDVKFHTSDIHSRFIVKISAYFSVLTNLPYPSFNVAGMYSVGYLLT